MARCAGCAAARALRRLRAFWRALHLDCREGLERAEPLRCERCWLPGDLLCARCEAEPPAFDWLRAPYRFVGPVHRAILEAKFGGVTALLEPLAEATARVVPESWAIDLVVSVPLHRVRATPAQAGLDAMECARNIRGAFGSDPVSGVVLLVDDVATTDATFDAAARALLDAGARRVYALSLARED